MKHEILREICATQGGQACSPETAPRWQMSNFEASNPILSSPFEEPKEHRWIHEGQPGVEMIDPRGNELPVVRKPENA